MPAPGSGTGFVPPTQVKAVHVNPDGSLKVFKGVKGMLGYTSPNGAGEEKLEKKVSKQIARERKKTDSYNPGMSVENITGEIPVIGGYGWRPETISFWKYLTPWERDQIKDATRLFAKKKFGAMIIRFKDDRLDRIIKRFEETALARPREQQMMRNGDIRYVVSPEYRQVDVSETSNCEMVRRFASQIEAVKT